MMREITKQTGEWTTRRVIVSDSVAIDWIDAALVPCAGWYAADVSTPERRVHTLMDAMMRAHRADRSALRVSFAVACRTDEWTGVVSYRFAARVIGRDSERVIVVTLVTIEVGMLRGGTRTPPSRSGLRNSAKPATQNLRSLVRGDASRTAVSADTQQA